jgi:hypothetical protein
MTVERDVIIKTLQAARKASEASLLAIAAVEKMLVEPEETASADGVEELEKACDHAKAIPVNVGGGSYLVCPCGEQITQ